jgi:hypothetical protein
VNAALSGGWLCFERDGEKRRLAPVPEHWLDASDEELDALCRRSTPAPPTRRLIE